LPTALEQQIEVLFDAKPARYTEEDRKLFREFKEDLNAGRVRSAEPDASQKSGWRTNTWVKKRNSRRLPMGPSRHVDRSEKLPFSIKILIR